MQILFALLVIFWWIGVWGMFDLLTAEWDNDEKFRLYIGLIILVLSFLVLYPEMINRL